MVPKGIGTSLMAMPPLLSAETGEQKAHGEHLFLFLLSPFLPTQKIQRGKTKIMPT